MNHSFCLLVVDELATLVTADLIFILEMDCSKNLTTACCCCVDLSMVCCCYVIPNHCDHCVGPMLCNGCLRVALSIAPGNESVPFVDYDASSTCLTTVQS